jgi:small basic protein
MMGKGDYEDFRIALVMGMRPIAVRSFGAVVAVALGFAGTRWGAQAALAAIAALGIAVISIEQLLESRRA